MEISESGGSPWVRLNLASTNYLGEKLITFVIKMPKFMVAQFNTHRNISKNSASTRAIPIKKQFDRVGNDLFIPPVLTKNQKGMSSSTLIPPDDYEAAEKLIVSYYFNTAQPFVDELSNKYNIHKQHSGRYLEPFFYTDVVATANLNWWQDLVRQRDSEHAQPEFKRIAVEINSILRMLGEGKDIKYVYRFTKQYQWHAPFLTDTERAWMEAGQIPKEFKEQFKPEDIELFWCAISSARCARVSYLNHEGKQSYEDDMDLFSRLLKDGHMSPFEHVASPINHKWGGVYFKEYVGLMNNNFCGWYQYRSYLEREFNGK